MASRWSPRTTPTIEEQVDLIRTHLREERDNFAAGDFDDPAVIHGHDMPGVSALTAGYTDITVTYVELPAGPSSPTAPTCPRS